MSKHLVHIQGVSTIHLRFRNPGLSSVWLHARKLCRTSKYSARVLATTPHSCVSLFVTRHRDTISSVDGLSRNCVAPNVLYRTPHRSNQLFVRSTGNRGSNTGGGSCIMTPSISTPARIRIRRWGISHATIVCVLPIAVPPVCSHSAAVIRGFL